MRALFGGTFGLVAFCLGYVACALFKVPRPVYDCVGREWLWGIAFFGAKITWYGQLGWAVVAGTVGTGAGLAYARLRSRAPSPATLVRLAGFVACMLLLDLVYSFCLVWSIR
jgi:hypothetical protein